MSSKKRKSKQKQADQVVSAANTEQAGNNTAGDAVKPSEPE